MVNIERVSMIDSNLTQLNSDYDFTAFELWLTGWASWVLFDDMTAKAEFALSWTSWTVDISAGKAIIVCTRATASPITNKKLAIRYELSSTKSLSTLSGDKVYIEIDQSLIDNPTLIEDTYPSTSYAQGKGIWVLTNSASYPVTNSYIKLRENVANVWTDVRTTPKLLANRMDFIDADGNFSTEWSITALDLIALRSSTAQEFYTPTWGVQEQIDAVIASIPSALWFGDWSDWNVTITTTVTLTRDMYYNNLTITSPGVLIPAWYRFFVKWTLAGNGKIQRNGNAWSPWVLTVGWAGAVALNQWTLNAELWAWAGWNSWATGVVGTAGTASNPSYTIIDGVSWWSSNGANSAAWWIGWVSTRWVLYNTAYNPLRALYSIIWPASYSAQTQYKWASSSGWGWGAWNWWGTNWSGGGGWGGGNWWLIRAGINIINWTGTWEAIWWVWWAGQNGYNNGSWNGWWWGGWGGGNWGVVVVIYSTLTSFWTETYTAWSWWVWWTALWWWSAGSTWTTWNTWVAIKIAV